MDIEELELDRISKKLGGSITYLTTYSHSGRTSKKIVIEYDIEHNKRKPV